MQVANRDAPHPPAMGGLLAEIQGGAATLRKAQPAAAPAAVPTGSTSNAGGGIDNPLMAAILSKGQAGLRKTAVPDKPRREDGATHGGGGSQRPLSLMEEMKLKGGKKSLKRTPIPTPKESADRREKNQTFHRSGGGGLVGALAMAMEQRRAVINRRDDDDDNDDDDDDDADWDPSDSDGD